MQITNKKSRGRNQMSFFIKVEHRRHIFIVGLAYKTYNVAVKRNGLEVVLAFKASVTYLLPYSSNTSFSI